MNGGNPSVFLGGFPLIRPDVVLPFLDLAGSVILSVSAEASAASVPSSSTLDPSSPFSGFSGGIFSVPLAVGAVSGIRYATAERWKFRLWGRGHLEPAKIRHARLELGLRVVRRNALNAAACIRLEFALRSAALKTVVKMKCG
jgi:hypothetical protein